MRSLTEDQRDAIVAAADLVGRSGGRGFEIGYMNDDPPYNWYAQALYQGARVIADGEAHPVIAAEKLARKVLDGGLCTRCGATVQLGGEHGGIGCLWVRVGPKWIRTCGGP